MAVQRREQDIITRKMILLQPSPLVKYLRFGSQHFYPPCAPRVCALLRTWVQISGCPAQARPSSHLCSLARGAGVLLTEPCACTASCGAQERGYPSFGVERPATPLRAAVSTAAPFSVRVQSLLQPSCLSDSYKKLEKPPPRTFPGGRPRGRVEEAFSEGRSVSGVLWHPKAGQGGQSRALLGLGGARRAAGGAGRFSSGSGGDTASGEVSPRVAASL